MQASALFALTQNSLPHTKTIPMPSLVSVRLTQFVKSSSPEPSPLPCRPFNFGKHSEDMGILEAGGILHPSTHILFLGLGGSLLPEQDIL